MTEQQPQKCYICCDDASYFVLPPCNHKNMCWKCCVKLINGSIFTCPFCNSSSDSKSIVLFVDSVQMKTQTFQSIIQKGPYKSKKNTFYLYSNLKVAEFLELGTSNSCQFCGQIFESLNFLKKHLHQGHRRQFCDVCLDNRKCLLSQQIIYSDTELNSHLKEGEYSEHGQLTLYHPNCDFCKTRFYDAQAFKMHLRTSSHLQCQICQKITDKFRFVYYKDYAQIERHFEKSHVVCTQGMCVGKKLENVFATQTDYEQHKNKVHKKNRPDKGQNKITIPSSMLGFSHKDEQQKEKELQWDKIGNNFSREFEILNKTFKLQKQLHKDMMIDIRDFYSQKSKEPVHFSLDYIVQKFTQAISAHGYKTQEIHINWVDFFKPFEMSALTRVQLEKFIERVFQPKFSKPIIQIFFTRRNQFKLDDYFLEIKSRMCQFSKFSFYYAFPQLIRFMKDENAAKKPMDQFYAASLHQLRVNKVLLFHQKNSYSEMMIFIKKLTQEITRERIVQQQIDIEVYLEFLKDMNINFFNEHHAKLFYVQKDKMINLYHMVDKCKTQDMLKLNWLLKVGLSKNSFETVTQKLYYRTIDNSHSILKNLTTQEIALLYAYTRICLEVLFDKSTFEQRKRKSNPLFLGQILKQIKDPNISLKIRDHIEKAENKSLQIQVRHYQPKNKGIIINQFDYPSLIEPLKQGGKKSKKNEMNPLQSIAFGKTRLPIWNEDQAIKKKRKQNIGVNKKEQDQQYPSLHSQSAGYRQNVKKKTRKKQQSEDEQDFPVFELNKTHVKVPQTTGEQIRIQSKKQTKNKAQNYFTLMGNMKYTPAKWDQNKARQKFEKINNAQITEIAAIKKEQSNLNKNSKIKEDYSTNKALVTPKQIDSDEQMKRAIQASKKSYQEQVRLKESSKKSCQEQERLSYKKQAKKLQQPVQQKKRKRKRNKKQKVQEKFQQVVQQVVKVEEKIPSRLPNKFEYEIDDDFPNLAPIKQQEIKKQKPKQKQILYYQTKNRGKISMRADMTDSQEQKRRENQKKRKENQQYERSKFNINDEDFQPLSNEPVMSIVNKLQKEGQKQKQDIVKQVKKNRKGKATVIQKVNLYDL